MIASKTISKNAAKIKVDFVITALGIGGAEMMLVRLLRNLDRSRYDLRVITLKSSGFLEQNVRSLGIPLGSAGMDSVARAFGGMIRLRGLFLERRPDLVFCWMYHANLIGGLAAKTSGVPHVFWNVRNSGLKLSWKNLPTLIIIRLGSFFSRFIPEVIVMNSNAAGENHIRMGYAKKKIRVIPNGLDTQEFKPDKAAGIRTRAELHFSESDLLVGMAARFHPQKDYPNLLKAARIVVDHNPRVKFVLCGQGIDESNTHLKEWILADSLENNVILLGKRRDMPQLMNAWDLAVLSSAYGESFPNVVAEAMSCEVPCVVTDVGDSALIVSDTGLVVPPGDPGALAHAILDLLSDQNLRKEMGKRARKRVINNFSIKKTTEDYEQVIDDCISTANPRKVSC